MDGVLSVADLGSFHGVPAHEVVTIWPEVAPLIQKAIDRSQGEMTVEDVAKFIAERDMQLWVAEKNGRVSAAFVTSIANHPRLRVLRIVLCGGEGLGEWRDAAQAQFEKFAKANGCRQLDIIGRRGWGRALEGWQEAYVVFRRDII